jgi:SpoVK/Ycf46/Vps4 family AAA+-type ATPase
MTDANSLANDFVVDHPLLLRLPQLIDDTTGIIAVSITLAFETVMTFSDQLEHSSVNLYQALLRAYLPNRDLDSLMNATGYDELISQDLSANLDERFQRVQGAVRAISALGYSNNACLTGTELLEKCHLCESLERHELVLICGFIGREDGILKLQYLEFYEQLLLAKGVYPSEDNSGEYEADDGECSDDDSLYDEIADTQPYGVDLIVKNLLKEYKELLFGLIALFAGTSLYDHRKVAEIKAALKQGMNQAVERSRFDLSDLTPLSALLGIEQSGSPDSSPASYQRPSSKAPKPRQEQQEDKESRIEEIWQSTRGEPTVEQRTKTLLKKLDKLTGMESVKLQLRELVQFCLLQQDRSRHGLKVQRAGLHMVFTGNPGTGKTSVARLIGELMQGLGWLSKGHFTEVSRADLVGRYVGHTAVKTTEILEKALGGVLFVDEAYMLTPGDALEADDDDTFGQEALDTILAYMENHRDDLLVIVAGYHEEMLRFLESNPGLRSRFTRFLEFPDYSESELAQIFQQMADQQSYCLSPSCQQQLETLMEQTLRQSRKGFGNGREVRNLFELTLTKQSARLAGLSGRSRDDLVTIMAEDLPLDRSAESAVESEAVPMAELNQLVGVDAVKQELRTLLNLLRVQQLRREQDMPVTEVGCHLVFAGNPGTGKTTVARILARELHRIGFCRNDRLVEVDRAGLVGGYLGQTALKVEQVVESALGGVLFIDEAYSLVNREDDTFGQEAVDGLLKLMEDHRNDLVVIAAGYPEEMETFLDSNPGLRSRFSRTINFCDYTVQELLLIFRGMLTGAGLVLEDSATPLLRQVLQQLKQEAGDRFANGRSVRQLFEQVQANQANRLMSDNGTIPSTEELGLIKKVDISADANDLADLITPMTRTGSDPW